MLKAPSLLLSACICFFLLGCIKENPFIENKVPKASAGTASSITLPVDTATLSGTGTDADGSVAAYLWSQLSGPSATVITNPASPSTLIKFGDAGRYVFQLAVTDNKGATGVDTTSVLVNPAVIKTFTAQPSNNTDEFMMINDNGQNQSGYGSLEIAVTAWTKAGFPYTNRELLKFDISSIPATATIISANLFLYSYPSPTVTGNGQDANYGSNNTMLVQQVISNWSPASTGWFNQPQTTTANQIAVPSTTQSMLDLNMDVTNMISVMVKNNTNYGFLLKIQNEQYYNSRIFVSSFNTTYTTKYPKLVIQYK